MERLGEVKRFLDSVHGTIKVPLEWCSKIIDTAVFQRLRRIEQNSCRAVYPSARHDRFIHSLGVYHLGTLISRHLANECDCLPHNWNVIHKTYRLACLLHDVGHTPFSHTFEVYFNEHSLRNVLRERLNDETFNNDLNARQKPMTQHELLSAYVALINFKDNLKDDEIDWPLLVRMIIGLPYADANDQPDNSRFENIMIELIHGTIDADGLDYVCRDTWAGGYHNFSIDLGRLIEAIKVTKINENYKLSFSPKALNEIESVLNIKNFQFLYVIKHHKVLLEQYYLVEGVRDAAFFHTGKERNEALECICTHEAFNEQGIKLDKTGYQLSMPTDDDFVALMKLSVPHSDYIKGWFSRQYRHSPLWKSKMAFFETFIDVMYNIPVPENIQRTGSSEEYLKNMRSEIIAALCKDGAIKDSVCQGLNLKAEDIVIEKIEPKVRKINPDEIYVSIGEHPKKYSELTHDSFTLISEMTPYSYWYVNLESIEGATKRDKINRVILEIKKYLRELYKA